MARTPSSFMSQGLLGLAVLICGVQAAFAQSLDRLGLPGPLIFGDTSYALAWSAQPTPGYYKQEYVPAGQVPGKHDRMLLIELLDNGTSVDAALATQVRWLNQRKGKDPVFNLAILKNPKTGETLLDFLISDRGTDGRQIAEWNAYRYTPWQDNAGRQGVFLLAISRRAYGDGAITTFLSGLKPVRSGDIDRLAKFQRLDARPQR